ncbi:hypothetical protein RND71_013698 [Anisodus tanguticus]|uniref:AT-hook motif nuclear-localized protein n=1 Tax=Anisodus tanguticus TaxID=243964 RepID=A0AAE1S8G5_9SOLA|nr:hypothetical protein RND71_013698 [Anisodus tanguticus]
MSSLPQQHNSYGLLDNINNSSMMQQQQNPGFGFDYSDGSSPRASGFSMEPVRKKRGRPRKYSPDGNIALGLSSSPVTPISSSVVGLHNDSAGSAITPSSDNSSKKIRGRPPTPGKIQLDALGAGGVGFTPHVIVVNVGEDLASKLMAFSEQGPRTVCILSAHGAICNVTLRQPAMGGGTVAYEGRFEIISLSGSFLHSTRTSSLSVSLAGSDGRVLGGGVAGTLMAATQVQVIVGSFIAEGKKPKSKTPSLTPPPSNMLNFGGPASGGASPPPSQYASSDSDDENGGSPLSHEQGPYGNAGQPLHGMPMYANMGWSNNNVKMVP